MTNMVHMKVSKITRFALVSDVWMDELGFYVPFNSISVISGQWKGEYERLCAKKRRNIGFRTRQMGLKLLHIIEYKLIDICHIQV